jgi:hypothetical protein
VTYLLLTAAALTWPRPSHGQTTPTGTQIGVVHTPCEPSLYDAGALVGSLSVELTALGVTQVALVQSAELAVLQVRCRAETQSVEFSVVDLATGQRSTREWLLADVQPEARPRALAMAAVTLLEAAWSQAARRPTGELPEDVVQALRRRLRADVQPPPAPPTVAAPLAIETRDRQITTSIVTNALVRTFPARGTALLGVELGADPALSKRIRLTLRTEALLGGQELSDQRGVIANMHLYWLTAGAGLEWASATDPELAIGPYARAGYAIADTEAERSTFTGKTKSGLVTVVGVTASLRAALADSLDAAVGLDLGYVPNGVVFLADLSRTAGMADVTLAAHVGVSWGPWR